MDFGRIALALAMKKDKRNVSVASRGKWYQGSSAGTAVDVTFRSMHEALCDLDSLVLMYGNFYQDGRTTGLAPLEINVSVDVDSKTYPLFFNNGEAKKIIALGASALSDELRISIKKGTRFFVRTHIHLNAGEKHPTGLTLLGGQNVGEGIMTGDATTGTFTSETPNPLFAYAPLVILGEPSRQRPFKTVGLCGDSISTGAGHTNASVDGKPVGDLGFMQIGALRAEWGYVTAGMNGQKASDFADPSKRTNQLKMMKDCDLVIVEYGTNDLAAGRTFEQLRADILSIHKLYWSMGIPTAQTTIAPQTTSTDAWATLENQAPVNMHTAGGEESTRSKINNWIRSNTDEIICIEIADLWESSRNSGLWGVDPKLTNDGVHPNNTAHDNAAANAVRDYLLSFR